MFSSRASEANLELSAAMRATEYSEARIVLIDDSEEAIELLEHILKRAGYDRVKGVTDPEQAAAVFMGFEPDLVVLDLHMPRMDGFRLLEQLSSLTPANDYRPIIVITADVSTEARKRALRSGASDYLTKPFDAVEVLLRIGNLLHTRALYSQLRQQNRMLLDRVRVGGFELEEARLEILIRLARAAEYRDDSTGQHAQRVGRTAAAIACALGLPEDQARLIRLAAPLHDVGKIGIPDRILLKPGKLSRHEFEIMKTHTTIGARILVGSRLPLLQMAEEIAMTHHERWDGHGYYPWLRRDEVPASGRIVAVADVFDALTHKRPYKDAWPVESALAEIERASGRQFDPQVVKAFLTLPHYELVGDPAATWEWGAPAMAPDRRLVNQLR